MKKAFVSRLMNTPERRVWLGFGVVVFVAILVGILVWETTSRLHRGHDNVAETYQTLHALGVTLSSLQDVETGEHGYLLTGDPAFLGPYNTGTERVAEGIARLRTLTAADPLQQERLSVLEALSTEKIDFAREGVAIRDGQGREAADRFVASGRGKAVMDDVRAVIASMNQTETGRLQRSTSASDTDTRNSNILMGAIAVLALAMSATLLLTVTRALASQRRAAEADAHLGAIVESSSDAILSLDLDGRITSWNPSAERLSGYSAEEAIGQPVSFFVPADEAALQEESLRTVRQGHRVSGQETARIAKDGRRIDVSLSRSPLLDASGNVIGVSGILRDISEAKRAEHTLRDSQERFAAIFDASPVAIVIADLEGGAIVDVNGTFSEVTGFSREEALGRTTVELGLSPDPAARAEMYDRVQHPGDVHGLPARIRTKSGEIRDVTVSSRALEIDGRTRVLSLLDDVTAHKRLEQDLDRLFSTSQDFICIAGLDGFFKRLNPAFERVLGYSQEELLSRPFADFVHPDDAGATGQAVDEQGEGRQVIGFTNRYRCKDGTYRWLEWNSVPDAESGLLYAVARDITAQKELEDARRAGEERFRSVVETASDAIIITDRLGNIELFNPAAEETFGYTVDETLGQHIGMLVPSPEEEAEDGYVAGFLAAATNEVVSLRREMVGQRKDGSLFPHELTVNAMQLGEEPKFTAIIRDITGRRQMEDELREAKEAAEEANRAKSQFLSRMSHELRTPLNVVLGFAQVLQLDPLEEPQTEAVEHILTAGRHLLDLIDEVLDISRIEAGRLSLSIEPLHAGELVADTLLLIQPLASQRRVTVRADPGSCAEYVLADRQRLKQVLLNLLSNAIKYNREGGSVEVVCARVDAGLRVIVTDTGPGLPPEKQRRLFTPFDRLGAEATNVAGTGLGLALSKHLVEAMGGTIGVESAAGAGSRFWVELPLGEPPAHPPARQDAVEPSAGADLSNERHTILYIEDNLSNLHLMERILSHRQGFRLLAAMQGSLGLDLAREHHPDAILLDLHLPDMPGTEVLRELKANPGTADIPVIVLSADASADQVKRLLEAGARAYLTKPFDLAEFLTVTDSILQAGSE